KLSSICSPKKLPEHTSPHLRLVKSRVQRDIQNNALRLIVNRRSQVFSKILHFESLSLARRHVPSAERPIFRLIHRPGPQFSHCHPSTSLRMTVSCAHDPH